MNEMKALGEVLKNYPDAIIATDDMYEHIVWTEEGFCNILNACPELKPRTVVMNGVSKAYAMTGWRIGYAGGPEQIINAMKKIQSQSTSNPTSISQWASVQAAIDANPETSNDVEFSSWVLDKAGVAIVPGSAFGTEGHIRLSYATSMENLEKAMQRMTELLNAG